MPSCARVAVRVESFMDSVDLTAEAESRRERRRRWKICKPLLFSVVPIPPSASLRLSGDLLFEQRRVLAAAAEKTACILDRNPLDEITHGGSANSVGARAGDGTGDRVAPHRDQFDHGARSFTE